ncbi:probable pterin-4-alpha-carbinolamine dehydratase, chloroplastic [Lolium rigidum]|uniref:probable pterin-4-alpha-carbinolamine dehydratase, chloroplastic n=1 Tax=Lolium rigidum TaxID=89674 RepID=UPI001F5C7543|nr:probable pterin-4-alpha-carbinolamine dehydratase, chloroplastic [Lolium rigidum]
MALMLSPAAPAAAFSVVAPGNGKAAATMRIRLGSRSLRKVVAMADMLGDFGARDPFPEEIASEWGEKTLGNVDTLHRILIPTVSVLSLSRVPLQADPELLSQDDARRLLHKVVGWRLLFPCTHDNQDDLLKLECVWKVKDQACGEELVSRITRALESGAGCGGYVPAKLGFEAPNQVRAQLYSTSLGGLSVNDFIIAARIDQIKTQDLIPKKRVWAC